MSPQSKLIKKNNYTIVADKFSNTPSTHRLHKTHSIHNLRGNKNIPLTRIFSHLDVPVDQLHGSSSYNIKRIYSTKTSSPTESYDTCSSISLLSPKQQSDYSFLHTIIRSCSSSSYRILEFISVPRNLFFRNNIHHSTRSTCNIPKVVLLSLSRKKTPRIVEPLKIQANSISKYF